MAFCEDCGAPLSVGVLFCENCGAKVTENKSAAVKAGKTVIEEGILFKFCALILRKSSVIYKKNTNFAIII